MLQLRKFSNQRRSSNEHLNNISGSGGVGGIQMSLLNQENNSTNANNNNASASQVMSNPIPTTTINLDNNNNNTKGGVLNPNLIANLQFDTEAINTEINLEWIYKPWVQRLVRLCAFCSFLSICANTPETFKKYRTVMLCSYATDLFASLVFLIEMIAKIKIRGLLRGERAYMFDRWCQFDGLMVVFHLVSVIFQTLSIMGKEKLYWSLFRCPRPLILIRVIRSLLKFRLPKNRINSILQYVEFINYLSISSFYFRFFV
jgi:hypothetical protein